MPSILVDTGVWYSLCDKADSEARTANFAI